MSSYDNERDMWDAIVEQDKPVEKLQVSKVQFIGGTTSVLKLGGGMVTIDLDHRFDEDDYDEGDEHDWRKGHEPEEVDVEDCPDCGLTVDAGEMVAGVCRYCYQYR